MESASLFTQARGRNFRRRSTIFLHPVPLSNYRLRLADPHVAHPPFLDVDTRCRAFLSRARSQRRHRLSESCLGKFYVSLPWLWCALLAATVLTGFLGTDLRRPKVKAIRFQQHGGPEVLKYTDAPEPVDSRQ